MSPRARSAAIRGALLLSLGADCAGGPLPTGALVSGCAMVTPTGACWTESGDISVWAPSGVVAVDGVRARGVPVDAGQRFDVKADEDALITINGAALVRVVRGLDGVGACPAASPIGAAWCERLAARDQMERESPDVVAAAFERAAAAFEAAGWSREAAINRTRGAWAKVKAGLSAPPAPPAGPAWDAQRSLMAARVDEVLLRDAGDLHALRRLQRAVVELQARVGGEDDLRRARLRLLRTDLALGDAHAAVPSLLAELDHADGDTCEALDVSAEIGWMLGQRWLARTANADAIHGAAVALARLDPARIDRCDGMDRRADRYVDRALLQLVAGEVDAAASSLHAAGERNQRAETRLWWRLLRAEVALAEGRGADAIAEADAALEASDDAGLAEGAWAARDLRARALVALGDLPAALGSFDDASRELASVAALTPLLGGRAAFLDQRADAVAHHVDALVEAGRAADAFEVARAWRRADAAGTAAAEQLDSGAYTSSGRLGVVHPAGGAAQAPSAMAHDVGRSEDAYGGADTGARPDLSVQVRALQAQRARTSRLERALKLAPASDTGRLEAELRAARDTELSLVDEATRGLATAGPGRPLGLGEATLVVAPAGDRSRPGWRALWRDDLGTLAGPVIDEAAVLRGVEALLPVGADRLLGARVVNLMLPATLEALPLHLAPVRGAPWALQVPVRWSLDLPALDTPPLDPVAVVVGDPEGALAGARQEAQHAAERLRGLRWQVVELGRGADHAALAAALDVHRPAWLHIAAHGLTEAGDPRLRLADGTAWTVRDALTLPAAPAVVLLSGCRSAASRPATSAPLGLAHAFVRGGAFAVFASVHDVDDDVAARVSAALLDARPWPTGAVRVPDDAPTTTPEIALQAVLRRAAADGQLERVSSYRVITR